VSSLVLAWALTGSLHRTADSATDQSGAGSEPAGVIVQHIGNPHVVALQGADGDATLHVVAEVSADQLSSTATDAIPLGAPVTLTIQVPGDLAGSSPRLSAELLQPGAGAAAGTPDPATASTPGSVGPATGSVSLDRTETFLYNRTDGTFVLPQGAGPSSTGLGHQHGASLTKNMPAGGFAWATTFAAEPSDVSVDPAGRWVATTQAAQGTVELVDLVARTGPTTATVGGQPTVATFGPTGSELWVAGPGTGLATIALPDTTPRRVPGVDDAVAVAISDDGALVLAVDRAGTAHLVDGSARRVVGTTQVGSGFTDVGFASAVDGGSFVVAGNDGRVRVLPVGGGRLGTPRTIDIASSGTTDVSAVAVAPDGSTLLVSDQESDAVVVVDLAAGRVLQTVDAGPDPAEIAILEHFAIVRIVGAADAKWIDLDDPTQSNDVSIGSTPPSSLLSAPGNTEVLAPVPAEQRVFRLHVMNGHPMVMASDDDPIAADVAIAVVGRIHETAPGQFEQRTAFDAPGRYMLRFETGSAVATWELTVAVPLIEIVARPLDEVMAAKVGQSINVRFAVSAGTSLVSPEVLAYASTPEGPRQQRVAATAVEGNVYEATLVLEAPSEYSVHLLDAGAGLTAEKSAAATIIVTD
jgi:YVTN family beta-propeller protein